jgi:hypothetical protein
MEHRTTSVAIIDALAKLAWPAIALLALLAFKGALSELLERAATQIQGGTSVELAGLKITLPKSSLPKPPERVKNILPKLEQETLQYILVNVGEGENAVCYQAPNDASNPFIVDDFHPDSAESRLEGLGLITRQKKTTPYKDDDGKSCDAGSVIRYTRVYPLVRNYLIVKSLEFGN